MCMHVVERTITVYVHVLCYTSHAGVIMDDTMNCHRDTLIESCSQLSRTCIRQLQTIDNSKTVNIPLDILY